MKNRITIVGLITVGITALHGELAQAQARSSSQDVQIYAGYLFGDRMLETPLSGSTPRLNDNGIFGARYTYHFTDMWGVQLSAGYSPSRAAHVASGDTNLGLTTVGGEILPAAEWYGFLFAAAVGDYRDADNQLGELIKQLDPSLPVAKLVADEYLQSMPGLPIAIDRDVRFANEKTAWILNS